jgi:hypothetical protein
MLKTGGAYDVKPGEVQQGKCMYYNTDAVLQRFATTPAENMKEEEKTKLFFDALTDSGM